MRTSTHPRPSASGRDHDNAVWVAGQGAGKSFPMPRLIWAIHSPQRGGIDTNAAPLIPLKVQKGHVK